MPAITEELKVCIDCMLIIEGYNDDIDADREGEILAAIQEYADKGYTLHNNYGEDKEEFSWKQCELCGSTLGGERHHVTAFKPNGEEQQ